MAVLVKAIKIKPLDLVCGSPSECFQKETRLYFSGECSISQLWIIIILVYRVPQYRSTARTGSLSPLHVQMKFETFLSFRNRDMK